MTAWFNNITAQIQKEINEVVPSKGNVNDLFQSLTLRSPELAEEQARITEEEIRKESVKDALASLLPWDTRNEEHEILVAECQEEILALSVDEKTFQEPYGKDNLEAEAKALQSLEDYPALLRRFDLDAHVGLVQRLFKEDANLVEMHSQFSGTGEREYYFWKNYFFHCAMIRFRIGLSNSEIWDVPTVSTTSKVQQSSLVSKIPFFSTPGISKPTSSAASGVSSATSLGENGEEEDVSITFESTSMGSSSPTSQHSSKKYSNPTSSGTQHQTSSPPNSTTGLASEKNASVSPERDYEIIVPSDEDLDDEIDDDDISAGDGTGLGDIGDGDDELDDLEAEIARELES